MARKRKSRRGGNSFTIPLAVVGGFAPLAIDTINWWQVGGWKSGLSTVCAGLTGYNPEVKEWSFDTWWKGSMPIVMGLLIHKLVGGKLGVNRAIARSGIPWLRI